MSHDVQDQVREIAQQVLLRLRDARPDGGVPGGEEARQSPRTSEVRMIRYGADGGRERTCSRKGTEEKGEDFTPPLGSSPVGEEDRMSVTSPVPGVQVRDERLLRDLVRSTPARIAVGRAGPRPRTDTLLQFRADHAAAVDAVYGEVDERILEEFGLFAVDTLAGDKDTYIRRPDLGRKLTPQSVHLIQHKCVMRPQVQVVVSDGLSSQAVMANLRDIYPALCQSLKHYGLTMGTPFYVRRGRVAIMDEIGELLQPEAFVLLIGERPGLVAADSMSAYLCYRPRRGTVEADRMVVSNIHAAGTPPVEAGAHLGAVVKKMIEKKASGVKLAAMD